jgi:predicted transcriptional regulator of viral defense system
MPGTVRRVRDQVDWEGVGTLAEGQAGFLTTRQARELGVDRDALAYHARPGGRLERAARGLYRLRFFPGSPFDHVAAAWVASGPEEAVVTHESALELSELADVIPGEVHLTLPRERRSRRARDGVRLHRPRTPLRDEEIRTVHGMRVTSVERTLLDVLHDATQREQVEAAIDQALDRALTTPARLRAAASGWPATTRRALERRLADR